MGGGADMSLDILDWCGLLLGAFVAGSLDAVVGGGGLIQVPLLWASFPSLPPATVFGTNKLASVFGTSWAAWQYSRRVRFDNRVLRGMAVMALCGAVAGASMVTWLPVAWFRVLAIVLLIGVALYTWQRPNLGVQASPVVVSHSRWLVYALALVLVIGFYDGIFGPGTGSFLIFAFIRVLGMQFVQASAHAKFVNMCTNIAAIGWFAAQGPLLWWVGGCMALANMAGAHWGSRWALRLGDRFVRQVFLWVVVAMVVRLLMSFV